MTVLILMVAHLLMSAAMSSIPYMTRRELLFGVVLPADFRSRPEGRRAIRIYQMAVAISGAAGLVMIAVLNARVAAIPLLASGMMILSGFATFVVQHRKLLQFAIQPRPIRELELSGEPERLPRFVWLGLVPLLVLVAAGLYLHTHWDSIPDHRPIHWDIHGQPNGWTDRTIGGVYGPLIFAACASLWLFGFSLAIWYGSRRSEPLRKPALLVFIILEWAFVSMIVALALQSWTGLPVALAPAIFVPVVIGCVAYLIKVNRGARGPLDPTPKECWKGGLLYYNPDDPVLFVGRRDGAGFTLNMGNPWSWVVLGSPLLMAVCGLFLQR